MQLDDSCREGIDDSTVTSGKQNHEYNDKSSSEELFICVSPHEQSIFDQINELTKVLTQYTNKCIKMKQKNTNTLEREILKLQEYNKLIRLSFDNAINKLILKCQNEIDNNTKKFEILQNKINKHSNDLKLYQTQFKQYLNDKTNNNCKKNNYNFSNGIKQTQSNVNKLLHYDCECIVPISINNDLDVDTFISQFITKINDSFSIEKIKTTATPLTETQSIVTSVDRIAMNYVNMNGEEKETQHQEQKASNIDKTNKVDWRFNFHYDYRNHGSKMHGIENSGQSIFSSIFFGKDSRHGKSVKCNWKDDYQCCRCFCTMSNNGMKPNSGIYSIKMKINKIDNRWNRGNIIGITSEKYDNNHKKINYYANYYNWFDQSNNYIGWSACDKQDDIELPNGLYCGFGDNGRKNNIFRKNNFVYQSKNGNYKTRLPGFKDGDILVLSYDSVLNQLSFFKETDDGKLNSFIENLPKNMIFYWFVAHWDKNPISISIVD